MICKMIHLLMLLRQIRCSLNIILRFILTFLVTLLTDILAIPSIVSFQFNVKRPDPFTYNVRLKTCLAPQPLKISIYREGIQLVMHLIPTVTDAITVILISRLELPNPCPLLFVGCVKSFQTNGIKVYSTDLSSIKLVFNFMLFENLLSLE